ncbi:hypothetical protein EMCRGX_G015193 [Ephydatia muelleri]
MVFSYENNEPQKSGGQPANSNPYKIVASIRAVAPPIQMGFSLDEQGSNHPVILEQLRCPICLMISDCLSEHSASAARFRVISEVRLYTRCAEIQINAIKLLCIRYEILQHINVSRAFLAPG